MRKALIAEEGTSWVMSGTGFSGFAKASLHHLLKRATEGFLPTARLFARHWQFWGHYGVPLNNRFIANECKQTIQLGPA
jgi:hypothetical protein